MFSLLAVILLTGAVEAKRIYPAEVERVIDGDTLVVWMELREGLKERHRVRLLYIDAPEMKQCPKGGAKARDMLLVLAGERVFIEATAKDSFGRLLASVRNEAGEDISQILLEAGMARKYPAPDDWCP